MKREHVYRDMKDKLGLVPTFVKSLPDATLELEWELMQRVQMDEGPISNKDRELIGVGISAATKCRYCTYFHTQFARLFGATEAEIEAAVHYAKSTAGWSTYVNGLQIDYDQFTKEIDQICEHVKSSVMAKA